MLTSCKYVVQNNGQASERTLGDPVYERGIPGREEVLQGIGVAIEGELGNSRKYWRT